MYLISEWISRLHCAAWSMGFGTLVNKIYCASEPAHCKIISACEEIFAVYFIVLWTPDGFLFCVCSMLRNSLSNRDTCESCSRMVENCLNYLIIENIPDEKFCVPLWASQERLVEIAWGFKICLCITPDHKMWRTVVMGREFLGSLVHIVNGTFCENIAAFLILLYGHLNILPQLCPRKLY